MDRFRFHHSRLPGEDSTFELIHWRANYRLCGQNVVTVWPELTCCFVHLEVQVLSLIAQGRRLFWSKSRVAPSTRKQISYAQLISGTLCYIDKLTGKLVVLQYFRAPNSI